MNAGSGGESRRRRRRCGFRRPTDCSWNSSPTPGRTRGGPGTLVDVICQPEAPRGLVSAGTVHHVAWRAPDEGAQAEWRVVIAGTELNATPVIDRNYFRSISFREPGGVLLEIATDAPGFVIDEPLLELGRRLQLPPWLEPKRAEIEAPLPDLRVPDVTPASTEPGSG